ncbi:Tn3 family transposase [Streptomyces sp. NPDC059679]|uniref:Tn3 family transposase n=1 Tax=Streptomyces sp. NPDC059679 TaxID=3346903 RepID=UPI00367B37CB
MPIASLLVEMDRHTGFLDCFVHAGGKQARSPQLKRNLIACLIGLSTNVGLHGMAASCGIPYDVLAWTAEWYIREETLREANIVLVNYHHRLPMTAMFGSGTLSSSDGQRFPTRGKSVTARHLNKYFVSEGISTYTHVSDQHSTFGSTVIVATHREAYYVLDEILGNATDLPITEHAADTHGVTLVNFGLFDLVGKQLSPRIRDLGKITLYRMGSKADYTERFPSTGPLLTKKANLDLVADHWGDLLRLAVSAGQIGTVPVRAGYESVEAVRDLRDDAVRPRRCCGGVQQQGVVGGAGLAEVDVGAQVHGPAGEVLRDQADPGPHAVRVRLGEVGAVPGHRAAEGQDGPGRGLVVARTRLRPGGFIGCGRYMLPPRLEDSECIFMRRRPRH